MPTKHIDCDYRKQLDWESAAHRRISLEADLLLHNRCGKELEAELQRAGEEENEARKAFIASFVPYDPMAQLAPYASGTPAAAPVVAAPVVVAPVIYPEEPNF
jgi:hypothetical protein